jgi:hypothetical protein
MKRLLLATLLLAALAAAADRELTGRVVDANTGEPIARAHLTIRFFQGQSVPEATLLTDADGNFKITDLPASGFQVFCEKTGYLAANQGMPPVLPGNTADGRSTATMVLKMTAQAAIEGTVVDDRNLPSQGAYLQLVRQQVVNGRLRWQPAQGAATDETGYFRVFGLPAGRYYISVSGRIMGGRSSKALAYAPFYYPSGTEIAAAQPVDLKAGDDAEIKIQLPEPVTAYTVSGVVATAGQNANVSLMRQTATSTFEQYAGGVKWDARTKTFQISHVTPGTYLLQVMVPLDHGFTYASTTISVGSADVAGIRLEPAEMKIEGTVRLEDSTATQRVAGFISAQSDRNGNGGQVDGDGKFQIPTMQPGTYRIVPQITGVQSCVRSVLSGGRDVRDGLTVTPGVAVDPLDIVMTTHCGSIDVSLTPSDTPLPLNLTAYLLRKVGDDFVLEKQGFPGPRSNDGSEHFLLRGVAAGDYVVYVWPNDAQIEYANADYMRQFSSYGQSVTVSDDSKTPVTVDKVLLPPAKN